MLRHRKIFLLLFSAVMVLTSCSLQKRHYRHGFYFDFYSRNQSSFQGTREDSVEVTIHESNLTVDTTSSEEISADSSVTDLSHSDEHFGSTPVERVHRNHSEEVLSGPLSVPRDEVPPDQDRPNKKIFWMMLISVLLAASTVGILFPPVSVLFFILPVLGLALFIIALYYRRRVLRLLIAGGKGETVQLSKFYPNFALALYLFFGAIAAAFIGLAFIGSIVPIIGIVLFEGGMIVGGASLILLVVLSVFWICKWRKQGEGRKKPWEPRPKDP